MKNLIYVLIIGLLLSCKDNKFQKKSFELTPVNSTTTNETSIETNPITYQKWYEGGTLHSATIAEWKKATERNKLATCGDFIANIIKDKSTSLSIIKEKAENLRTCINEAVKSSDYTNDMKVSKMAAICVTLM